MAACTQVQPDGTLEPLASPVWNWSAFYERTLRDLMQSGIPSRSEEIAVNNWWGLSTGMVDIELSPSLPSGVKQLALLLKDSIIRGTFDPFVRPIHDQTGARKSDGTHSFTPEELMDSFPDIEKVLCTDISRDGMLQGVDTAYYAALQAKYPSREISVSGGISSEEDILRLEEAGLRSVIVGKAIYEGRVDLAKCLQNV